MVLCNDPIIGYLKSFGFNIVRLPKADLSPLEMVIGQRRDLDRFGALSTVLQGDGTVDIPPLKEDLPAPNISGQRTAKLSLGLGLSVLGNIVGAMGGSKLGLDVRYEQAKTVSFEFVDVLEDRIEVARLDQFLGSADVNPHSVHAQRLLEADDVFVVTSVIKSKKVSVDAQTSSDSGIELSIPEIQGVVGGNVKVSGSGETSSKLTYEGQIPLGFGFQAVRLFYDEGRYSAIAPLEPGTGGLRALEKGPKDGAQRLMADGPFVRLAEV